MINDHDKVARRRLITQRIPRWAVKMGLSDSDRQKGWTQGVDVLNDRQANRQRISVPMT